MSHEHDQPIFVDLLALAVVLDLLVGIVIYLLRD